MVPRPSTAVARCAVPSLPPAATLLAALLFVTGVGVEPAVAQSAPTPPEALPASGAAYRTGKSMFFGLRKVEVVGTTTTLSVALEPASPPDTWRVVVTIGVADLDSGEPERDAWVTETLGGPEAAPLRFTSRPVTRSELSALLAGRGLDLAGTLGLPAGPRDVAFTVGAWDLPARDGTSSERFLEAWARTTFDALGIEVPSVGPAGVIASPGDDLELWLRVPVAELRDMIAGSTPPDRPR